MKTAKDIEFRTGDWLIIDHYQYRLYDDKRMELLRKDVRHGGRISECPHYEYREGGELTRDHARKRFAIDTQDEVLLAIKSVAGCGLVEISQMAGQTGFRIPGSPDWTVPSSDALPGMVADVLCQMNKDASKASVAGFLSTIGEDSHRPKLPISIPPPGASELDIKRKPDTKAKSKRWLWTLAGCIVSIGLIKLLGWPWCLTVWGVLILVACIVSFRRRKRKH